MSEPTMSANRLMPMIEQLDNCQTHADRARWLLECPPAILLTYQMTIRQRLQLAYFQAGLDYLECELACLRAVRRNGVMIMANGAHAALVDVKFKGMKIGDVEISEE